MASLSIAEIRDVVTSGCVSCSGAPIAGDISSWDTNFQEQWYRAHDIVGAAFCMEPPATKIQADADCLRSTVFQHVLLTTSDDALAAYTSDDFYLIINAAILGVEDSWIAKLWNTYRHGRSPYVEAT
ncbi:MAG: hypothetical protein Aurels2KO_55250 [Aureliella sp.]